MSGWPMTGCGSPSPNHTTLGNETLEYSKVLHHRFAGIGKPHPAIVRAYTTVLLGELRSSTEHLPDRRLLLIAEQAKQNLLKDGWKELPLNATRPSRETH